MQSLGYLEPSIIHESDDFVVFTHKSPKEVTFFAKISTNTLLMYGCVAAEAAVDDNLHCMTVYFNGKTISLKDLQFLLKDLCFCKTQKVG